MEKQKKTLGSHPLRRDLSIDIHCIIFRYSLINLQVFISLDV